MNFQWNGELPFYCEDCDIAGIAEGQTQTAILKSLRTQHTTTSIERVREGLHDEQCPGNHVYLTMVIDLETKMLDGRIPKGNAPKRLHFAYPRDPNRSLCYVAPKRGARLTTDAGAVTCAVCRRIMNEDERRRIEVVR